MSIPVLNIKTIKGCDVYTLPERRHLGFIIGRTLPVLKETAQALAGPGSFDDSYAYHADNGQILDFVLSIRKIETLSREAVV